MKIRIEILGGNNKGKCLKDVVEQALKRRGYASYSEFAKLVAKRTKSSEHAEAACVCRVIQGQTSRLDPERAKVYAEILEIPEKDLLEFSGAGSYHRKSKPIIVGDDTDITSVVKKLAQNGSVSLEDLVKEFLYMQHQ